MQSTDDILKKLETLKYANEGDIWNKHRCWDNWTEEEKQKMLEIYFLICKKESHLFDLVYSHQGCDSWEDIFRDYDEVLLEEKAEGVDMALDNLKKYKSS